MTDDEWLKLADRTAWENKWLSEYPLPEMSKRDRRRLAHDAWLEMRRQERAGERIARRARNRSLWRAVAHVKREKPQRGASGTGES
jgi:hypothetical protein